MSTETMHGESPSKNLDNDKKDDIKEMGEINILLLSETGVGKSTFINAVSNYLMHKDIEKAEKGKLFVLIPSKFKIDGKKNGKKGKYEILVGKCDENEFLGTGESATQDVKSYIFPIGKNHRNIRLIDTPGMGDTRGPEQDRRNCDYILNYISNLRELHAICCLFKSSNTKSTIYFQYCITQILSYLHKSASKNIVFAFTFTRGSNYQSGDTYEILEKMLQEIRVKSKAEIPLGENLFCFDNESFKYLAALQDGIKFDKSDKEKYKESWNRSRNAFWKMKKYVMNIEPYSVQNTIAINEARRVINLLAKPLADIMELILENIEILERQQKKLDNGNLTLDELRNELYMPAVDLDVQALDQPTTVCTALKCVEMHKVGDKDKIHYKQRCHEICYLKNVQEELLNNSRLYFCKAMDIFGNCKVCTCSFRFHMHMYYTTSTKEVRIVNENVNANISSEERMQAEVETHIANLLVRKNELQSEQETIVESCAKFTHFLQKNAITSFNDKYKEYIQYLISRQEVLEASSANTSHSEQLKDLLKSYDATMKLFEESATLDTAHEFTANDMKTTVEELFRLTHCGGKINELYTTQQAARQREHEYTDYVHPPIPKVVQKLKGKGNKPDGIIQKARRFFHRRGGLKQAHQELQSETEIDITIGEEACETNDESSRGSYSNPNRVVAEDINLISKSETQEKSNSNFQTTDETAILGANDFSRAGTTFLDRNKTLADDSSDKLQEKMTESFGKEQTMKETVSKPAREMADEKAADESSDEWEVI